MAEPDRNQGVHEAQELRIFKKVSRIKDQARFITWINRAFDKYRLKSWGLKTVESLDWHQVSRREGGGSDRMSRAVNHTLHNTNRKRQKEEGKTREGKLSNPAGRI